MYSFLHLLSLHKYPFSDVLLKYIRMKTALSRKKVKMMCKNIAEEGYNSRFRSKFSIYTLFLFNF